eukprot:jgi/Chrzof1/4680/Cz14g22170.t1
MAMSTKYVVLGGGNASGYVAKEFAAKGIEKGQLTIITDEPVVAYERPALSKAYLFPEGAARLPGFHTAVGGGGDRQEPGWYSEKGIDYRTNTKVTAVDVKAKLLAFQNGDKLTYDKLIVATGARPVYLTEFKTPGAELEGIHYLRNVSDADKLLAAIKEAKTRGNKAVVIGGGYIGLEVSAGLCLQGLEVTMVFPEPHVMPRLFTPELAAFYEKFYTDKGIKLMEGALANGFEGKDGKVTTVKLNNGQTLEAELVLVGVGARPNIEMFDGQLKTEKGGILVDGTLKSSDPDVYAVGDVATFPLVIEGGSLVRQEHVAHARQSAVHAVNAILGSDAPYDYLPYFYSREFNLSWQFYGVSEGEAVHFGDQGAGKFGAYWVRDGQVVGAFLESGSNDDNAAIKAVAKLRPTAPSLDELKKQGIQFALEQQTSDKLAHL